MLNNNFFLKSKDAHFQRLMRVVLYVVKVRKRKFTSPVGRSTSSSWSLQQDRAETPDSSPGRPQSSLLPGMPAWVSAVELIQLQ